MAPKIKHKRSSVSGNFPTEDQLDVGEIALNIHPDNPTIFFEDATGTPVVRSVGADPTAVGLYARNIGTANAPGTWQNLSTTTPGDGSFGYWSRSGTTITPRTAGDNLTVGGDITLSGVGETLVFTGSDNNAVARTVTLAARTGEATFTGNLTFNLPVVDGNNGQALVTDGSGNLSWATPSAGSASQITRTGTTTASTANYRVMLGKADNTATGSDCFVVTDATRLTYNADTDTLGGCANFSGTATNCSRQVIAGSGLSGGGVLNANRTLSVDSTVIRTTGAQHKDGNFSVIGGNHLAISGQQGSEVRSRAGIGKPSLSNKLTTNGCWLEYNTVIGVGNNNEGAYFGNTNASTGWTTVVKFGNGSSGNACGQIQCKKDNEPRFSTSSDRRLKTDIRDAESMLEKFEQVKVRRFTKTDPFTPDEPSYDVLGFIADELQQVFPDAVEGEPNATMTVGNIVTDNGVVIQADVEDPKTSGAVLEECHHFAAKRGEVPKYQTVTEAGLLTPMVKAVQELIAINKDLAARVEKLEGGTAAATTTRKRKS